MSPTRTPRPPGFNEAATKRSRRLVRQQLVVMRNVALQ